MLLRRMALGTVVVGWSLVVLATGCPPRETLIEITPTGAGVLVNACAFDPIELTGLCDGVAEACMDVTDQRCTEAVALCGKLQQQLAASTCRLEGLSRFPALAEGPQRLGLVLTLVSGEQAVRDQSACSTLVLSCSDTRCIADALNEVLGSAIADGLGFDGLSEPQDAVPVLLLFTDHDGDGEVGCAKEELFACAALGERGPGADNYDVLCGSCQGGQRSPINAAPCGSCFLPTCAKIVDAL